MLISHIVGRSLIKQTLMLVLANLETKLHMVNDNHSVQDSHS
jgi:hypothetical protein